jgi:hypothetical protein
MSLAIFLCFEVKVNLHRYGPQVNSKFHQEFLGLTGK